MTDPELTKLIISSIGGALIALFSSAVGSILTFVSSVKNNHKNIFVNTITSERAKWRSDIRSATADLVQAVEIALKDLSPENINKIHAARVAVRLRLNPSSDSIHFLDQNILAALRALTSAVKNRNETDAHNQLEIIEVNIQKLLKQEWDKSKREAISGKLEKNRYMPFYERRNFINKTKPQPILHNT